jgi:hypothetical protein
VLVQADFPTGWTGTPATPDTPEDKANNQEFATCTGASGDAANIADIKGDDFSMGSPGTQVSSEAQISKDEASYRKNVDALKSSKFQPCLQTLVTKALTKALGSAPTNVQVAPITVPSFGDVTVGIRTTAGITVQGQNLTVAVDQVAMGKNKSEVLATFTNIAQPFDANLEKTLIDKLGAKLEAS